MISRTKAIIIAAGRGSRMEKMTKDQPKCLIKLNGTSLIERQLTILKSLGIHDISIIKGYRGDKINFPGIKYFINPNWENNNILESLFYAETMLKGEVIILYSDIILNKEIVKRLKKSQDEIAIVVDTNWKNNYLNRKDHPIAQAENVVFDELLYVRQIGKFLDGKKPEVNGEFIGALKLKENGAQVFKNIYYHCKKQYGHGPFQKAKVFNQAYLTDLLQELVDRSEKVICVPIRNGWREIDTVEDFNNASHDLKVGKL